MAMNYTAKGTLMDVLDDVNEVLWIDHVVNSATDLASVTSAIELPVIEDSIECDLGSVDAAYTKTTDGTIAAAKFTKGDPSCGFNVVSIHSTINKLFASQVSADKANVTVTGASELTVQGYSGNMLATSGAIIMRSADKSKMVCFPNVKLTGSFKPTGGGDANTGYWECKYVPRNNESGAQFYISDQAAGSATHEWVVVTTGTVDVVVTVLPVASAANLNKIVKLGDTLYKCVAK